ncbi:MAG: S49 family peptidase [Myxococcota bacterium]
MQANGQDAAKERQQGEKSSTSSKRRAFVLDFHGDISASAAENLRHEVSAIVSAASDGDEVIVRLESSGGMVHSYGLAASQLHRIRHRGLRLTACVDKIAASGGYMMACVASEIVAAPFAILGSIGVAAPVPNINRLLSQHGIDYEDFTAGEFKRSVSLFGPYQRKRPSEIPRTNR